MQSGGVGLESPYIVRFYFNGDEGIVVVGYHHEEDLVEQIAGQWETMYSRYLSFEVAPTGVLPHWHTHNYLMNVYHTPSIGHLQALLQAIREARPLPTEAARFYQIASDMISGRIDAIGNIESINREMSDALNEEII